MKRLSKIISLILVLIIISTSLLSCTARPLAQSKLAKTVVGTVGTHDVYYEEFYLLANDYYKTAKEKYGDDKKAIEDYVWKSVKENIIFNYAVLDLCASEGIEYDEKELKSEIEQIIEADIESNFGGSRSEYLKSQISVGITDHYYRFFTGVDILYSRLATKYQEDGRLPNTDEKIMDYIKENFIHTFHIAVYVDENENRDEEYAKILRAKQLLDDGNSIYSVFGESCNENLIPSNLQGGVDGYYFPRGVMDTVYENAAFALKNVGDRSDIIVSHGTSSSTGKYVECFYIIEKLPMNDSEIKANFNTLADMIKDSIIPQELEKYYEKLSFTPNDYALSLDLANLEAPQNGADYTVIIAIVASVSCVILITVAIFVFRTVRAKRFHKKHKKK